MEKPAANGVANLDEIKKMIKHDKMSIGRLKSLKLPRNLNLGGTKPKKVYTPNLNAIRNKEKQTQSTAKKPPAQRPQKRRLEDSKHTNNKVKYIQSDGVFSQGVGEAKHSTSQNIRVQYASNPTSLAIPKINKGQVIKNDDQRATELLYDNDTDSESDDDYFPVVLPLSCNKKPFSSKFSLKKEPLIKIKTEVPSDQNDTTQLLVNCKADVKVENPEPVVIRPQSAFMDDGTKYDDDNLVFSLIELPSTFIGKVWSDDAKETDLDYTLKCLPEGQIGKICVHKSGKMDFVVQNTEFRLRVAEPECFEQTAVQFPGKESISLEPSLVTLGNVTENLMVTPDWNKMFKSAQQKSKFYW
ncbi:hypothetical protein PPYR_12278 [Photinus pyralis]|uniref:Uncharacterized protein n=1 Tax=Photinus pyralis TaxID=7054 RepID=A0A1Y1N8D5_PHOPY|nr:uncharacterized protein LOC116176072 [Photinus pyralis]KAB0795439.1 hypothetical protein PPYR_12278 [Photinus pyralis]